jgi:hypothetical protein
VVDKTEEMEYSDTNNDNNPKGGAAMTTVDEILEEIEDEFTDVNDGSVGAIQQWLEWDDGDLECPSCKADIGTTCEKCGHEPLECDCPELPTHWYCLTCTTTWDRDVFWWETTGDDETPEEVPFEPEITPAATTKTKPAKKLECVCTPPKDYTCTVCKVTRVSKSDPWKAQDATGTTNNYGTTYMTHKCRHFEFPVVFPDGTIVHATSKKDRKEGDHRPDLGMYLDSSWTPASLAYYVKWWDYGLPEWDDVAIQTIQVVLDAAKAGQFVEIGCIGGHGRTGVVLAAMASVCGVPPLKAVKWVRKNYCKEAIETEQQEWWVEYFHATVNGYKVKRAMPAKKVKTYTSTTTGYTSVNHLEQHHYVMLHLGMPCKENGCNFWEKDLANFAKGIWNPQTPIQTINDRIEEVMTWRVKNDATKDSLTFANIKKICEGEYFCHCGKPHLGTKACSCSTRTGLSCAKCDPSVKPTQTSFAGFTVGTLCHCGKPFTGTGGCDCDRFLPETCKMYPECSTANSTVLTDEAKKALYVSQMLQANDEQKALDVPKPEPKPPFVGTISEEDWKAVTVSLCTATLDAIAKKKAEEAAKKKSEKKTSSQNSSKGSKATTDTSKKVKPFCEICAMGQNHTDGHDWFITEGLAKIDGGRILASGTLVELGWPMVDAFMSMYFGVGWSYWSENTDPEPRKRQSAFDARCVKPGCNEWLTQFAFDCPRCGLKYSTEWWTKCDKVARADMDPAPGTRVGEWEFDSYTTGWKKIEVNPDDWHVHSGLVEFAPQCWRSASSLNVADWDKLLHKESATIS